MRLRKGPLVCLSGPGKNPPTLLIACYRLPLPNLPQAARCRKCTKHAPNRLRHLAPPSAPPLYTHTRYNALLQVSAISLHNCPGILCNAVCAICVPYKPPVPWFLPCWAVVICLLPNMLGHIPGPGHNFPVKLMLFHKRVLLRYPQSQ